MTIAVKILLSSVIVLLASAWASTANDKDIAEAEENGDDPTRINIIIDNTTAITGVVSMLVFIIDVFYLIWRN
jgi:hypothetical protein